MQDGHLGVAQRLCAGAFAGMSATLATHPLDVVRLRLSLPQTGYTGTLCDTSAGVSDTMNLYAELCEHVITHDHPADQVL